MTVATPALRLDHVSVAVPDLPTAVDELMTRAGLRVTVSAAAPRRHGRLHLHRAYIEVTSADQARDWRVVGFFLGFDDPGQLRRHLDSTRLDYRFTTYDGVDGRWDDFEIDGGAVPMPILVRRTHPPEVAVDWPPALQVAHPCGARTLAAVRIAVRELEPAVDIYRRLLGVRPNEGVDPAGPRVVEFELANGRVVLVRGEDVGVDAIMLGVPRSWMTATTAGRVRWVDVAAARGLRLGLVNLQRSSVTDEDGEVGA